MFNDILAGYINSTRRNYRRKGLVNMSLQENPMDEMHSLGGKFALLTKGTLVGNRYI